MQLLLGSSFPDSLPLSNVDTAAAAAAPLPTLRKLAARLANTSAYAIASALPPSAPPSSSSSSTSSSSSFSEEEDEDEDESVFSTDLRGVVLASLCGDDRAAV